MDTRAFLARVKRLPGYRGQVQHVQEIPARQARHASLEKPLPPLLQSALEVRGLFPLYTHQAQAIDAVRRGENVILSTGPASGKSLCYTVPVLEAALAEHGARSLYLFPTKALAQDQLRALDELARLLPHPPSFATYDGDTPGWQRAEIRRNARILFTNPDMLHLGILPNHRAWSSLLRNLRYVVLDEAHVYRGVFGSHLAQVLRRLRRTCRLYGSDPVFILASATLGNPGQHAGALAGLPFTVVEESGAPYGGKEFVLWDPPFLDEAKSSRRSPNREGTDLFTELVSSGVRTLAFVRSRQLAELLYRYAQEELRRRDSPLAHRISSYRAGYMAEERRDIERRLFQGELLGAIATNALELGIDIGDLDATVLIGYAGTIASTFQQASRSGRRRERSLSIFIAADNPLDHYLIRHPEALFGRSPEHALVSLDNPRILGPHLLCAAYEAPLTPADAALFGEAFGRVLAGLLEEGKLVERRGRWFIAPAEGYPAEKVNIRSSSYDFYALMEAKTGRLLETVEEDEAFYHAHPGAVYLHRGEEYVVEELDIEKKTAYLSPSSFPYYTQSMDVTDLRVLKGQEAKREGPTTVHLGEVDVTNTVVGYKKKRHVTEEVLGIEYLDLPATNFPTTALWWEVPGPILADLKTKKLDVAGGLHACEHAAIGLLPLFAMCDRWDIGGLSTPMHPDTGAATIFIYDGHPGGVGISARGYEAIKELWQATLDALAACPCEAGCPSCVQSPKCGNNNEPLDKEAAKVILRGLLRGGPEQSQVQQDP